ncbi:MAG: hypothetical protein IT381_04115 [Deltaproteobacteria bacterium]|nr:hypothetical protein [Deltaproteobacteria bacterium]
MTSPVFGGSSTGGAQPVRAAISRVRADARLNIVRVNARWAPLSDLYHFLIQMRWHWFLLLLTAAYLSANLVFAAIYTLLGDAISGANGFVDNFFFSVQTFATIGYGGLMPKTTLANSVVVLESMSGIFGVAILTGLMFAKFSRPSAHLLRLAGSDHEAQQEACADASPGQRARQLRRRSRSARDGGHARGHRGRRTHAAGVRSEARPGQSAVVRPLMERHA